MEEISNLWLYFVLFLGLSDLGVSQGENLDTEAPYYFTPGGLQGIEFGFSIGLFNNETHRRLLVGAPSANTSQDVNAPGALYACELGSPSSEVLCSQLPVDTRNSSDKYKPFITKEVKDNQRLGASMSTRNNHVTVCAPNWHYFEKRGRSMIDTPVGICFNSTNLDEFQAFSPPFDVKKGTTITYVNTGSCQSGFSVVLTQDDNNALGSPGCYNWKGDIWVEGDERWITQHTSQETEGQIQFYDKYTGYSVAAGTFGDLMGIAAGMPRATPITGKSSTKVSSPAVGIFRQVGSNLDLWTTLTPPRRQDGTHDPVWLFSYFGYSFAVGDVDGNGLDDVVVGAPFYHNSTHADQGAILVFNQMRELTIDRGEEIRMIPEDGVFMRLGESSQGRFGSSVSCLGDIDGDGSADIGVGAPYSHEGGTVYIYLGSKDGLSHFPNQIIKASEVKYTDHLKSFGFSIASSFRIAELGQNDLAVGAFESDKVVVFRSNAVLSTNWSLSFSGEMDLSSSCPLKRKRFPCTQVIVCLSYSFLGQQATQDKRQRAFDVEVHLDQDLSRIRFDDLSPTRALSFSVDYNKEQCKYESIYALASQQNLNPYVVQASLSFLPAEDDKATLDFRESTTKSELLQIEIECSSGNITTCVSDLQLSAEQYPKTVDIESANFKIIYNLTNFGETSYYNNMQLFLGEFVQISGAAEILGDSTIRPSITCTPTSKQEAYCNLGTFIDQGEKLFFKIPFSTTDTFLDIDNLRQHPKHFNISAKVTSLSKIKNPETSKTETLVQLSAHPKLDLSKDGFSTEIVYYNGSDTSVPPDEAKTGDEIGPTVTHSYKIYNPSGYAIENIQIDIYWPLYIQDYFLLFVKQRPELPGIKCQFEEKKGVLLPDMSSLPLVEDIKWYIYTCPKSFILPRDEIKINIASRFTQKTVALIDKGTLLDEVRSYIFLNSKPVLLGEEHTLESRNSIETDISYDLAKPPSYEIPAWAYVVGVLIGLVLLTLLACILKQLDFFKRKKKMPPTSSRNPPADDAQMAAASESRDESN